MPSITLPHIAEKLETKQSKHHLWWQQVLEFLLLAGVAVVVLEVSFRACGIGGQEFLEPDPVLGCRQIPNKQVTWRLEGFSNDKLSSIGHHDVEYSLAKPAGTRRILVLGDSATEGLQVSQNETYCRDLDQILNKESKYKYEVLNFGCSSYSTGQQMLQFEQEAVKYEPDITVVLYVRGAALQNIYNPYKRAAEPRPYFYLDTKNQLQEDDSILREQAASLAPNAEFDFLRKNSRIYGVLSQTNLSLGIHEKLFHKLRGWATGIIAKIAPSSANHSSRVFYPPQDVWQVTTALLKRLNEDCHNHGSKLVVVVFPNTVNDPIQIEKIPQLKKFAEEQNFGFLDLTPAFKAAPDANALFLQYHFSAAGHKVTADELARYLERSHFLQ